MSVDQLDVVERYLFLLFYAPDVTDKFAQAIRGKTWLQKEMFLLSKIRPELGERTEYDPHLMGAYSQIVDEIQDQLYISEYVEKAGDSLKLSLEGRRLAENVWIRTSEDEKRLVSSVKTLLNDLSQLELLGFIYTEFPETAVNSEKQLDVESRRVEIAINLFVKGKVPLEKAAEIAKQSVQSFHRILKERGIEVAEVETKSVLLDHHLLDEIEQSRDESEQGLLVPWEAIQNNP